MGHWHTHRSPNLGQKTRPNNNQQKKREIAKSSILLSRLTIDLNWKKMKRRISTWTLLGNWKKLWNMKVTIIPIVIDVFGTVTKGLLKGLEDLEVGGRVETIQTTALLRTARILRRVLETCCHSNSSGRPSALADVKKNNNNNNNLFVHSYMIFKYSYP